MAVNFNQLGQLAKPSIIGQISPTGGSDGGIGEIMSGLRSLVSSFPISSQQPSQQPVQTEFTNPNTYGSTSSNNQGLTTSPSLQFQQPTLQQQAVSNSPVGVVGKSLNQQIFDSAMKQYGMREGNQALNIYLQKANPNLDPSITPWCAGFVGSVLNANGLKGTGSLAAKSYLNYGTPTNQPQKGDIVVLNRTNNPAFGHVGFVDRIENGQVYVLGGNQGNSVSVKPFSMNQVAGFRQAPTGQQVQQFAQKNNIQNPQQLSNITKPKVSNDVNAAIAGIAHVESGGSDNPYILKSKASKNGDRAYGKYQIMGNNIPAWSKEALGRPITKQEFLDSPELQDQIARFKINQYMNQYKNVDDVWSMWFSGRPAAKAGNAKDVYGTTVPAYIKKAREGVSRYLRGVLNDKSPFKSPFQTPNQIPSNPHEQPKIPSNPLQRGLLAGLESGFGDKEINDRFWNSQGNINNMPMIVPNPEGDSYPIKGYPGDAPDNSIPNSQIAGVNWGLLQQLGRLA